MSNNQELKKTIHCPFCDREYLPCEIFYPDSFLGHEKNIERDVLDQIIYYEGSSPNPVESYICDKCGKQFKVTTIMEFVVEKDEQNNLNGNYFTPKPTKLFLDEDK